MKLLRKGSPKTTRDWYWDASPEERQEYDAFGPWIYPVRSEAETPRKFRPWYQAESDARYMLKLPVNADRSQMRPGQDLYRALIAIHDDRICLMEMVGSEVVKRIVRIEDIQGIRTWQNLLQSSFELLLDDGSRFRVDYSSVSSRQIETVIDFLRKRMIPPGKESSVAANRPNRWTGTIDDFFYRYLASHELGRNPELVTVLAEEPGRSCRDLAGHRCRSLGSLVLASATELVVVTRGKYLRRRFEAIYSQQELFIPRRELRSVALQAESGQARTLRLRLSSHELDLGLWVPENNLPGELAAVLGGLSA